MTLGWPQASVARDVRKPLIRLVFTHIPPEKPTWPNIGYDYEQRKQQIIGSLRTSCPGLELLPVTLHSASQAETLIQSDSHVDGYVVCMLGIWTGAPQVIAATGRPTLFIDDLYGGSGEFLVANAAARRTASR